MDQAQANAVADRSIVEVLGDRFSDAVVAVQPTADDVPTLWIVPGRVREVLRFLKCDLPRPYRMLFDLTAIDERTRVHREGQPPSDFTVVYYLMSLERNADVRIKAALEGDSPAIESITDLWPSANWYECEAWDMYGIRFLGHPMLRRLLMPRDWTGHPLRKDHPSRATEMEPFTLPPSRVEQSQAELLFRPEDWGMRRHSENLDFMFLNVGPHHPGTHGVLRLVLQLDGETVVDVVPDIGFHHRAAEKMGERQTWHTYIPYTDRVDYLAGVNNNMAYLMSVERLAGIELPDRAKVIRIMLAELFRIASHLVWYGTFAQDLGQLSPVFYMFSDRERIFDIIEAICGFRMHPGWFRMGGVSADLPRGWDQLVREFLDYMPRRLDEYDKIVMQNTIFRRRSIGIGEYTLEEAIAWGVTGPALRACGLAWDFRKMRPYGGYDQFEFDIPTAHRGDCYGRSVVRVEEMRQSLRIIRQCVDHMPPGPYKSRHPLTTPPMKEYTMHDIETLITHFLGVSWGPVVPEGEAMLPVENTKGANGYYAISDGDVIPYRMRIRAPSFAHMQTLPLLARGGLVSDLIAILGAMDFVMADVDR